MELSTQLPPIRALANTGNGSNNLFDFQGDIWAYVQTLENQIRELQARLERVEREKNHLADQLGNRSDAMEM